jgi:hypothetical protein
MQNLKDKALRNHLVSPIQHPQHNEILEAMDDFYNATCKFPFNDFDNVDIKKVKEYRENKLKQ